MSLIRTLDKNIAMTDIKMSVDASSNKTGIQAYQINLDLESKDQKLNNLYVLIDDLVKSHGLLRPQFSLLLNEKYCILCSCRIILRIHDTTNVRGFLKLSSAP